MVSAFGTVSGWYLGPPRPRIAARFPKSFRLTALAPSRSPDSRLPSLGSLMLGGMAVGAAAGAFLGERVLAGAFLGDIFIRLLVLAAVPLLFLNLVAALGAARPGGGLGRITLRIGGYFAVTSIAAAGITLVTVGLVRAGRGLDAGGSGDGEGAGFASPEVVDFLLALVPESVFGMFVEGEIPAIVVFGLMVGAAARGLEAGTRERVVRFAAAGAALFRRMVAGVLWFGPVGVAALAAASVGEHGAAVFGPLSRYLVAIWAAHAVVLGSYFLLLRFLSPWKPLDFLRATATVWTTTTATCSSLASLGASLEAAERIGLPRRVFRFTLPLGAQFNKDGSAVLLAGGFLFTAQAVGMEPNPGQLAASVLLAALLSAAAPGVPNGGVVNQLLLVQAFGMPVEMIVLVAGVYRLVDMPTTTLNIVGDLVGTTVVAGRRRQAEAGERR